MTLGAKLTLILKLALLFGILVAFAIVGSALVAGFLHSQQSNQVVRPLPVQAPNPAVSQLPAMVSYFQQAKSLAEGRGQQVKELNQRGRVSAAQLAKGQKLYTDAKTSFDGCIAYLRSGLARRFDNDDAIEIRRMMVEADQRLGMFIVWANAQISPGIGALTPLGKAIEAVSNWLNGVRELNDKAIEMLRQDLKDCELAAWKNL